MQEVTSVSRVVSLDQPNRPASARASARERPPDAASAADETKRASANEPADRKDRPAPGASAVQNTTSARLSYDFESEDVFIEILNPRTGDVIKRLPPEDAAAEINTLSGSLPGAVYDGTA